MCSSDLSCIQKYRDRGYTIVNDSLLLPVPTGLEGQRLELQPKRSMFDSETLFIPFDESATPSLPMFAEEVQWTLLVAGEACSLAGREAM